MRDGWLGKDPSTALEDGGLCHGSQDERVSVCVRIMFLLRSIKQPRGQVEAAAAWEKSKRQGPTSKTNVGLWNLTVIIMHQNSCRTASLANHFLLSQDNRGQCCITLQLHVEDDD